MKLVWGHIGDWDDEKASFWNSAVRGNSSLRVALSRALDMENYWGKGLVGCQFLWDMEKCYDTIRIGTTH